MYIRMWLFIFRGDFGKKGEWGHPTPRIGASAPKNPVMESRVRGIPGMAMNSSTKVEQLLAETRQYLTPQEMEKIQCAYDLANRAHMGVVRRSGEPYIQHPLEVALLLADMRIDADGIVAALLHDVVEDAHYSLDDLRKQFGAAVANIVDGVTKFDALVPGVAATAPSANAEIKVVQDT